MESLPHHYSRRLRPDEATDPNIHLLEEFQRIDAHFTELQHMEVRLGEKIDGRCGALKQRVNDVEQRAEERLVLLEIFHSEAKKERCEMEKQFGGLKLEVTRLNRFMERKSMVNSGGPGIFTTSDPSSSTPEKGVEGGSHQQP
jgi:hypothetical protein